MRGDRGKPTDRFSGPANDKSGKLQAASNAWQLVWDNIGYILKGYNMDNEQLKRIADAMEEILRMVKADQERSKKYMEEQKSE